MLRKKEKSISDVQKMLDKIIVIDVETAGLSARPESFVFGCAYGNKTKKVFYDVIEFRKWLISRQNRGKIIFAHNAEYDYTTIFDNILKNLDSSAIFVGSMFIIAEKNNVKFYNSLAILKTSVSELGKNLGLPKLDLDDKFKNEVNPKNIKVTKLDVEYCFRDCEIVFLFLETMFRKTEKIKPTVAGCAMEIFTKKYLTENIYIHELNENFRRSYYGGRVECFKLGKILKSFKYDINSLYPYVCTTIQFPNFERLKYSKKFSITDFKKCLKSFEGCADIEIEIPKNNFVGLLPFRTGKETIFPCGKIRGWYNFLEIRKAIEHGAKILKLFQTVYGERISFDSLKNYMLDFSEAKNRSEGAEKLINKFLLNSLTGKFAQRTQSNNIYFENFEEFDKVAHKYEKIEHELKFFSEDREDFFLIFQNNFKSKSWLIPTISSYITSGARCLMLDFYIKYQKNLLYTDTDSLIVSKPIDKKFIGDVLGMFKLEKDEVKEIKGNKHYISKIGEKEILYLKGVPKNFFMTGKKYTYNKMLKTKEALRRKKTAGIFVEVQKVLKEDYTKRIVLKNGNTKPLILT